MTSKTKCSPYNDVIKDLMKRYEKLPQWEKDLIRNYNE